MEQKIIGFIQDNYGVDISKAVEYAYQGSVVYSFEETDQIVFVRCGSMKARKTVLSETLWMDNLTLHTDAVCEPVPSKENHLTEVVEHEGMRYTVSMFYGKYLEIDDSLLTKPEYIEKVGALLGKIHTVSRLAGQENYHYQRKKWKEILRWGSEFLSRKYGAETVARIEELINQIDQYDETPETFGLIYGDFHWHNFYEKDKELRVYDFDACQYGFYIHDVASIYRACQKKGYQGEAEFIRVFRKGYDKSMTLPETEWDKLEEFMKLDECFEMLASATKRPVKKDHE